MFSGVLSHNVDCVHPSNSSQGCGHRGNAGEAPSASDKPPVSVLAWKELRIGLEHEWDRGDISGKDVLPAALCPKVFNSHEEHRATYGPEIDGLLTAPLLTPLEETQEMGAAFKKGAAATMKYRSMGKHRLAKGASGSGLFLADKR